MAFTNHSKITNSKGGIDNLKNKTTHREPVLSSEEFLNFDPIDLYTST